MTKTAKEKLFFIVSITLLCLVAFFSLRYGSVKLSLSEFLSAFLGGNSSASVIVRDLRLPRLLGGIFAGVGLSVAGVLVQSVTDNDMASPSTVGVNSGAGFFVAFYLAFSVVSIYYMPIFAFVGALLSTLFIVTASRTMGYGKTAIILVGLAINAVFTAGISLFELIDEGLAVSYRYFAIGSLSNVTLNQILVSAPLILVAFVVSWITAEKINLLRLGDGLAGSLGANVKGLKTFCVITASLSASLVVCYAGLLGFVGLIAPHIARAFVGGNLKKLIPASALTGALLVTTSDFLSRIIFSPTELPVGIIMALLGAPFFLYLLIRGKNNVRT